MNPTHTHYAPTDLQAPSPDRPWFLQISRGSWLAIASGFLAWTFEVYDLAVWALTLPVLLDVFAITKAQAGIVTSVTAAGSILGGIAIGWLADRIGRVRALYLSIVIYSIFSGLVALSSSLPALIVLRFIGGLGMGGAWSSAAALIAESMPDRHRGKGGAMMQAGLPIGFMLTVAVVALFTHANGGLAAGAWRWVFAVGALPALILWPVIRKTPESPVWLRQKEQPQAAPESAARVLGRPLLIAFAFIFFLQFVYWAVSSWTPTFLVTVKHMAFMKSLGFTLAQQVGTLAGFCVLAFLIDRIGRRPTFAVFLIAGAVSQVAFVASNEPSVLLAATVGVGFGIGGIFGGLGPFTAELLSHTRSRAFGMALAYNGGRVGGLVAPVVIGAMAATDQGFESGMLLTVVAMAAAGLVLWFAPETKNASIR